MLHAYSNDGMSRRAVDPDYQAQAGEVLSSTIMTDAELTSAFPAWADAKVSEAARVEILRLEDQVTNRRIREAVLGTDEGWLTQQEELIKIERAKL